MIEVTSRTTKVLVSTIVAVRTVSSVSWRTEVLQPWRRAPVKNSRSGRRQPEKLGCRQLTVAATCYKRLSFIFVFGLNAYSHPQSYGTIQMYYYYYYYYYYYSWYYKADWLTTGLMMRYLLVPRTNAVVPPNTTIIVTTITQLQTTTITPVHYHLD